MLIFIHKISLIILYFNFSNIIYKYIYIHIFHKLNIHIYIYIFNLWNIFSILKELNYFYGFESGSEYPR